MDHALFFDMVAERLGWQIKVTTKTETGRSIIHLGLTSQAASYTVIGGVTIGIVSEWTIMRYGATSVFVQPRIAFINPANLRIEKLTDFYVHFVDIHSVGQGVELLAPGHPEEVRPEALLVLRHNPN